MWLLKTDYHCLLKKRNEIPILFLVCDDRNNELRYVSYSPNRCLLFENGLPPGLWFSWTKPNVVHECGIEQERWNVAHAVLIQSDWMRLRELLINVPLRGGSITDRKRAQRALLAPCGPNKMAHIQTAFECIFLKELFCILIQISLEFVTLVTNSNWEDVSIGSGDGLAPNRRQAISCSNINQVSRRHSVSMNVVNCFWRGSRYGSILVETVLLGWLGSV